MASIGVRVFAASFFGLRALVGATLGFRLVPDTDAYLGLTGGPWFYPSVLGRLIGSGGIDRMAIASTLAAGALGYFVVALAQAHGSRGWLAIALVQLSLVGWYTQAVAFDSAGALCLVLAAYLRDTRLRDSAAVAGMLLHPASVVGYLGWRAWSGGVAAMLSVAAVASCGLAALLLSPYAGIVSAHGAGMFMPVVGTATLGLAAVGLSMLAGIRFGGPGLALALWALASGLLIAAAQENIQPRYLLPAVCLLAASAYWKGRPRWTGRSLSL